MEAHSPYQDELLDLSSLREQEQIEYVGPHGNEENALLDACCFEAICNSYDSTWFQGS